MRRHKLLITHIIRPRYITDLTRHIRVTNHTRHTRFIEIHTSRTRHRRHTSHTRNIVTDGTSNNVPCQIDRTRLMQPSSTRHTSSITFPVFETLACSLYTESISRSHSVVNGRQSGRNHGLYKPLYADLRSATSNRRSRHSISERK